MSNEKPQLEFPCDYPIKVMGRTRDDFDQIVAEILQPHAPEVTTGDMDTRESRNGNFVSVSVTIQATSYDQLSAISQALRDSEHVVMSL